MATVKVELILNGIQLTSDISDSDQVERFNKRDATNFSDLLSQQKDAKRFTHERKQNNGKIPKGKRVHADDYVGEPTYAHPGIHLGYEHDDKLVFWSKSKVNFVIEITSDPELVLVTDEDLDPSRRLTKQELLDRKHFPFFELQNPLIVVNGAETEPLKLRKVDHQGKPDPNGKPDERVLLQQYYKFSATVMGSPSITLDPHIEIHIDD